MTYIPFSVAATLAQKEFSWLKKLLDSHSYKKLALSHTCSWEQGKNYYWRNCLSSGTTQ